VPSGAAARTTPAWISGGATRLNCATAVSHNIFETLSAQGLQMALQDPARPTGGIPMQMLYNSENFAVVQIDLSASPDEGSGVAAGLRRRPGARRL
jgi:hypothetical protein